MKKSSLWLNYAAAAAVLVLVIDPAKAASSGDAELDLATSSLSGSYLAGRYAGRQRDVGIASRYFADALARDPGNAVLQERAFTLNLSSGQIGKAIDLADKVLNANKRHRLANAVLGLAALDDGDVATAVKKFEEASTTPIGQLTSALMAAWAQASAGNLELAFSALDELDKNQAFGNFKAFHAALIADYLKSANRSEKLFKQAYKSAGTSLRVAQAYGNYLQRTGRTDEAIEVYDQFLERSSNNPLIIAARKAAEQGETPELFVEQPEDGIAEALFSVASALTDERSIDVALIYVQLALHIRPDFPVAQTLLGEIYEDIKQYENAIAAFERIKPDSVLRSAADIQIAVNLNSLEKTDESIKHLKDLVAREPENYNAQLTLGNVYRAHEKWLKAVDIYSTALGLIDKPERRHWRLLYFRGIAYERSKQWEKAEKDFRDALELRPGQPSVLNYLGYSLIEKGLKLDEALGMVRRAVELRPNDGYIVDSLGWAHYQLGNFEEAVKHLERAVDLHPEDPIVNDHLGDAYWRVGRKLEASFQWQHSLDNKPEPDAEEKTKQKLKSGLPDDDNETNEAKADQ